jgi:hypothetical protein
MPSQKALSWTAAIYSSCAATAGIAPLLLQQHGDLDHPLAMGLECCLVAFDQRQLHPQGRQIEQPRLDVVGGDLRWQARQLTLQRFPVVCR